MDFGSIIIDSYKENETLFNDVSKSINIQSIPLAIENLTLELKGFKTLGIKIVQSLFSKIDSKNSEDNF